MQIGDYILGALAMILGLATLILFILAIYFDNKH
jgi:hypothetical protein